jgi:hypothetical protein
VGACAKLWIGVGDVKRVVILWIQRYPRHRHRERERERDRERESRVSELGATTDEHDPHELLTDNWNWSFFV